MITSATWNAINDIEDIQKIIDQSEKRPQLIYKHSNQCSVSFLAKDNLESEIEKLGQLADIHIVDVIQQREISNVLASRLEIRHESPQALLLIDRDVIWNGSHWDVNAEKILNRLESNTAE